MPRRQLPGNVAVLQSANLSRRTYLAMYPSRPVGMRCGSVPLLLACGSRRGRYRCCRESHGAVEAVVDRDEESYSAGWTGYGSSVNTLGAAVERAIAHLKDWKIFATRYGGPPRPFGDIRRAVPRPGRVRPVSGDAEVGGVR